MRGASYGVVGAVLDHDGHACMGGALGGSDEARKAPEQGKASVLRSLKMEKHLAATEGQSGCLQGISDQSCYSRVPPTTWPTMPMSRPRVERDVQAVDVHESFSASAWPTPLPLGPATRIMSGRAGRSATGLMRRCCRNSGKSPASVRSSNKGAKTEKVSRRVFLRV